LEFLRSSSDLSLKNGIKYLRSILDRILTFS
jgi:hypothetical protein